MRGGEFNFVPNFNGKIPLKNEHSLDFFAYFLHQGRK